ncbi:RNA polymerase sigma factor sigA, partial [Cucurbita argyrosperma subsp. sororia]
MMATTTAITGLGAAKRLFNSSSYYSDFTEKVLYANDHRIGQTQVSPTKSVVITARSSANFSPRNQSSNRHGHCIKAVKEHVDTPSSPTAEPRLHNSTIWEDEETDLKCTVEALLLLQKSMLEKQWNLSFDQTMLADTPRGKTQKKVPVTCSGVSARQRRMSSKRKIQSKHVLMAQPRISKQLRPTINPELLQNRLKGYVRGLLSEELLSHAEVVRLSKKIKVGLALEERKTRLKERLGCEPSEDQLAISLKISRAKLRSSVMECSLAREKLAMSNVRLVMSIAQRYDKMGAEMDDLVQGGLIGLLRGIEKFDSSKGFKISTYVYWWIRQGVSKALVENSRMLRLPTHMHERLGLIRNAKVRLQEKGITPSIDRIAESLNMSKKKVKNATEAISKVFSLDREAFPSLNGLPGETHHSYIADNCLENNPWHGTDIWILKAEVNKLITTTLGDREREIIRLYHGLDNECLTWEEISKRIGLSRERVRQIGLVAWEKLKKAAKTRQMEAMLLKH